MQKQKVETALGFSTGKLKTRYAIDKIIEANLYSGRLLRGKNEIHVSIQKFKDFDTAASYVDMMHEFNRDPNIANAYFCEESEEPDDLPGLVFLEPLHSFLLWMKCEKDNMWIYEGSKCIGVGPSFQAVFGEIGRGLESVNRKGYRHGNLMDYGVMFDVHSHIRLVNMDPYSNKQDNNKIEMLKTDLNDFKRLIEKAVEMDPPHSSDRPSDLDLFIDLYDYTYDKSDPLEFINNISVWIYQSFLFWEFSRASYFLDSINIIFEDNDVTFQTSGFLGRIDNWKNTVRNTHDPTMIQCLDYKHKGLKVSGSYGHSHGLVKFCRNFKAHPNGSDELNPYAGPKKSPDDALKIILRIFPQMLGYAYTDIFLELRTETLATGITFQDYFWNHTTIFLEESDSKKRPSPSVLIPVFKKVKRKKGKK